MRRTALLALAVSAAGTLTAQSNTVVGLNGRLEILDNITYWGRRGAAFPGGEVGLSMRNTMCNPGTVSIPWFAQMSENHPKFGFLICRESGGRFVQISDRSFCKHAFTSASTNGGCGTCNGIGGTQMGVGCSDTYSAGNNASRGNLGPADELDPWLGTWNHIGSYFDRGDPDVGPPGNTDGAQSPISTPDEVKNRVTVKEAELQVAGTFYYGIHLMHQGEAVANRGDNLASRGFTATFNGTTWNVANTAAGQLWGTILQRWSGANVQGAGNGVDDGRFFVASKVTPIAGGFHYEYAVHNVDNNRGGASLRIPVAAAATVTNFGFRDIDTNALNQWSATRVGNEIQFNAAAGNALNWNEIFNFWFDCTQSPSPGLVTIDEARIGPGALSVSVVNVDAPSGGVPVAFNTLVGTGCAGGTGPCQASVYENFATPAAFDLNGQSMGLSFNGTNYALAPASGAFVAPTGTNLALGDDAEAIVNLPFTLSFPGGSTTRLFVCSNGFVSAVSNGTDYNPTSSAFLTFNPCWSAGWHDLNPGAAGQVLSSVSPSVVRITWSGVPSFSGGGTHTFQYEFLPSNQVNIYWQTMTTTGNNYLVGWTAGHDANDPGNANLSAVIPAANLSLCPGSPNIQPLSMAPGSRPIIGTTVQMTTSNIPAGSPVQGLVYSFTQSIPPIDLTAIGMQGCFAYVDPSFQILSLNLAPGTTMVEPVAIPNQNNLIGITVTMQAVSYSPPRTSFGWLSSNGLVMFLAAL
jgi:hypothetical protein